MAGSGPAEDGGDVPALDLRELPASQRPQLHRRINRRLARFRLAQLRQERWQLEWLLESRKRRQAEELQASEATSPEPV